MDVKALRDIIHQQPFKPFLLRLADGRVLEVRHRDFIATSTRTVVVIDAKDDTLSILEPLLIVSLEMANGVLPSSSPPASPLSGAG